jgi:ligand-binding sensor domain-containing protein
VQEYGTLVDVFELDNQTWVSGPDLECESCAPFGLDADGRLWAGSDLGLWIFEDGAVAEAYNGDFGLPSSGVYAVAFGPDGTAWIGTDSGLAYYDNGDIPTVYDTSNSGLTYDAVYALLLASDGSLWVATEANLSRLLPEGEWLTYGEDDPFSFGVRVSDLAEDPNGDIWLSTLGDGLYRYRAADDEWDHYSPEMDGVDLITNEFNAIAAAPDGTVWAGAYFAGFVRFDGDAWQTFAELEGLIHSNVNDLYVDDDGAVWFATSGGVSRYEP